MIGNKIVLFLSLSMNKDSKFNTYFVYFGGNIVGQFLKVIHQNVELIIVDINSFIVLG